jgi:uncharacterized protein (DUF58 family)
MCAFLRPFGWTRRRPAASPVGPRPARDRRAAERLRQGELLPAEMLERVRRIEIRTKALVTEQFGGEYHSVFKGQGMEFAEVREYVPGDDIRSIDWNVTARFGQPFIKKYTEERELTVFFLIDASGSQQFGSAGRSKMELAAETCAVLAFSAIRNNDKVGLLIFSDRDELMIPPRKGRAHGLRLVRDILYFRPQGRATNLGAACETAIHALRRRSTVFLMSDFLIDPESVDRPLGALARKHDLIAVPLRDPIEQSWPNAGLIEGEDLETGASILIDTGDERIRKGLAYQFQRRQEQVTAVLRRHKVDQIPLTVGSDPVEPLMAFFRLRERRKVRG